MTKSHNKRDGYDRGLSEQKSSGDHRAAAMDFRQRPNIADGSRIIRGLRQAVEMAFR
jgi:hypothetical protein